MSCQDKAEIEKAAKTIFAEFDSDKSGFIESKEFEAAIKKYNDTSGDQKLTDAQIKQAAQDFIKEVDQNKDGKISCKEFCDLIVFLCSE